MDFCSSFLSTLIRGHQALNHGQYFKAIKHYRNAHHLYSACEYRCAELSSEVLLSQGDVLMRVRQYKEAVEVIHRALQDCPHSIQDSTGARRWLLHAELNNSSHPAVSVHCYSAALHFAHEDNHLKSAIYGRRALTYHKLKKFKKRDDDIVECRNYDPGVAMEQGIDCKKRGITLFNAKDFKTSVMVLELSTKFLESFRRHPLGSHHLRDCFNFMEAAQWTLKRYSEALILGNECYKLMSHKDKNGAFHWRRRGNDILRDSNYEHAIQCYTLAIQYAPIDDEKLLGVLYSNRSSAYFRNKQFLEARDDAENCLEYCPHWTKGYHRLGSALLELQKYDQALYVLRGGLNIWYQTLDEKIEIFRKIMSVVRNCEDGPMKITFEIPQDCLWAFLKDCVLKEDWKTVELLFLGGGGHQSYAQGAGGIATGCDASHVSLNDLIKSKIKYKVKNLRKLLSVLIDHGSPLDGFSDLPPLSVAVNMEDYESALVLLENNAAINGLLESRISKPDDTPIHTALRIGLSTGSWNIFRFLMDRCQSDWAGTNYIRELQDMQGNSLYHLVASNDKMSPHSTKGIDLLRRYNVDPTLRNNNGKTPLMMLMKKDERYRRIEKIVESFSSNASKETKPKSELDIIRDRITRAIDNLTVVHKDDQDENNKTGKENGSISTAVSLNNQVEKDPTATGKKLDDTFPSDDPKRRDDESVLVPHECSLNDFQEDKDDQFEDVSGERFDNLTWEVECTPDVLKILKDRRLSPQMKKRIVRIIRQLANGDMRGHLAIRLEGLPKQNGIRLFEAKLSRAARILWERAIAFSPRNSDNPELLNGVSQEGIGRIYSDIIRIWDIVFDHDTVPRAIGKIVQSHRRGSGCIIKKELKGFGASSCFSSTTKYEIAIPNLYAHKDDFVNQPELEHTTFKSSDGNENSTLFCPPGSPEDTEYHILKFYAFSNTLVSAVLDDRGKTSIDFPFPFRVSELEHAVINLKPNPMTSLLLLGRSGTGKTTCCLYRLWHNFQAYWQGRTIDEPGLLKTTQFVSTQSEDRATTEWQCAERCEEKNDVCDRLARPTQVENNPTCERSIDLGTNSKVGHQGNASGSHATWSDDSPIDGKEPAYEHLHQAFITKNAVLCTEVQKNFLDLRQACPSTRKHFEYRLPSSVNTFGQLEEQSWPLFVCSRDWLLMLDASLPEPAFFPRDDKGELLGTVKGWGQENTHLRLIPAGNFEDENDEEDEANPHPSINKPEQDDLQAASRTDPRLEVTYQVFKNELWPQMTKKKKVHYHPSLVWTEIRSFIKGSVEALHSECGYLSLEDYQTIGRKRARSFSTDREVVYDLFQVYQRIKGNRRMFDEADLVYHIYRRLQGHIPDWSIHEIYVDETQDFTQAELSVIIRCCRDPNRLFFTGDTAQSIMRGVAFRFNDLKSLFYYMKESYKAVGQQDQVRVPDRVYQLTHNYRSHAGILNLASSVIDLLLHFFPESFDRMERDQGLFDGPKPVLLESCSFSDLAVILRGHKRKTSPIEFGAHQVVLVASDEVRESLPDELRRALVMTIYEAKGLEFDDVLIYNFFKDSQAKKEWCVVNGYNHEHDLNVVTESGIAEIPEERLETKTRPLEFDPERHKILISEFKYLYTALTRARVNVWLFDEDEEARAPMFEYFKKRELLEVKDLSKVSVEGMFAQKSSEDEWRKEGHTFYRKRLWKPALHCFNMVKDDQMVLRCRAQLQADRASGFAHDLVMCKKEFAEAALLFLQCGLNDEAEVCLRNARERLLLEKLHQKLGKILKTTFP